MLYARTVTPSHDASAATRERLMHATEQLLVSRPAHEITVRDITQQAGANVAAVGYHFGGKDQLITATMRAAIKQITRERSAAITALAPDADLTSLVRAWLEPALHTLQGHPNNSGPWQLLARSLHSGSPLLAAVIAQEQDDVTPLLDRLSALLPHLSPDELAWRHGATLGLAAFVGSPGGAILGTPSNPIAAERFLAYVVAALNAPAAARAHDEK